MRIRTNDTVVILAGDERGQRGKVLKVDRAAGTVVVEGMNKVWKHVRRSQRNPQGGRLSKEMPVRLSNVMLVCPMCNQATRVGARPSDNGGKDRYCKQCLKTISQLAPSRAKAKVTADRR